MLFRSSSTTFTIGATGYNVFAVNQSAGSNAFTSGQRVRLIYGPSNYIEGLIAGYTGTNLGITVDYGYGSGSYTGWKVEIAGLQGVTGPSGIAGPSGPTGPTGLSGVNIWNGTAPPVNPVLYPYWFNTTNGTLSVWYVDANSSQWVQVDAPSMGPAGPVGATGPMGPTGAQGPQGIQGAQIGRAHV